MTSSVGAMTSYRRARGDSPAAPARRIAALRQHQDNHLPLIGQMRKTTTIR
jgi:hypothetical protein